MKKVLIFGSGSIGNHLANACRKIKLSVSVTDISFKALIRMKNEIYPLRYLKWDKQIQIIKYSDVFKSKTKYDLVIIGTPPGTHYSLIKKIFSKINFEKLMIEKPLSTYRTNIDYKMLSSMLYKKKIFVGYNHSVSESFSYFQNLLKKIKKKDLTFIGINWQEGWSGILNAHFWNKNEFSSYLGDISKGGGSTHEHSHGLHLLVCLGDIIKFKLPEQMNKFIHYKIKNKKIYYDNYVNINWKLNNFLINYTSDLITEPANKSISLFTKTEKYELIFNYKKKFDLVKKTKLKTGFSKLKLFKKKRSTDFINEINHILKTNTFQKYKKSFIKLNNGIETQKIVNTICKNG